MTSVHNGNLGNAGVTGLRRGAQGLPASAMQVQLTSEAALAAVVGSQNGRLNLANEARAGSWCR